MVTLKGTIDRPISAEPAILDLPAPDHVPRELIRDLRLHLGNCPVTTHEPYQHTQRLLAEDVPPVMWSPIPHMWLFKGCWILTRHADCASLYQDSETWSSEGPSDFQRLVGETWRNIPLSIDGPDHMMYRRYLQKWFTPQAVNAIDADMRALCEELIDEFLERGGGDVAHDFCRVFPVKVFSSLMGFPHSELEQFLAWGHEMLYNKDPVKTPEALRGIIAWLRNFIREKEAVPGPGVASQIVNGEVDGRPLTEDEKIGMIFFLWLGGLDTVASSLSQMFRRLAIEPDLQRRLRAEPELINSAVEEFLRTQPLVYSVRQLRKDLILHGVTMKQGDWAIALTSVANFDPAVFACPRDFDPARRGNRHYTLASGVHLCLGQHLARRELRIALELWLKRVPEFRPTEDDALEVVPSLQSVRTLQLTW